RPESPPSWNVRYVRAAAYLRVALTYMLISMPQGTSTIFGAFQAILALHCNGDVLPPSTIKYSVLISSPVNSFRMKLARVLLQCTRVPNVGLAGGTKAKPEQWFFARSRGEQDGHAAIGGWPYRIKNL